MRQRWAALWLLAAVLVAGCAQGDVLSSVLPDAGQMPGWTPIGDVQRFRTANLYDLVDGQADAFFAYGFEQVAVKTFEKGGGGTVRVEVWQLETPADAYGLFTTYRAGSPIAVGSMGDADPGSRLDFWQDRYFVRLSALPTVDSDVLLDLGQGIAAKLPVGGEPPSLVARLPTAGLVEGGDLFFHQEISVQDRLWLGGQNLLSLGAETDGVLASYNVGGETAWLLLVQYPEDRQAAAALKALEAGGIDSLGAAETNGNLLGAVFGMVSESDAANLLAGALDGG